MKIKKIESICKAKKTIIVYQDKDCQWLSDGTAAYPIYNLPHLEEENIFAMFDIPKEKQDKFYFEERDIPYEINFNSEDENECKLDIDGLLSIGIESSNYLALKTSSKVIFIDERYLKPFDGNAAELYERQQANGQSYIAVKRGLFIVGIILPENIISEKLVEKLRFMSEFTAYHLEQQGTDAKITEIYDSVQQKIE